MTRSISAPAMLFSCLTILAGGQLHAQGGCTSADSLNTEWVQSILDDDVYADGRADLGLVGVAGQQVVPLGVSPGDSTACATLYSRLNDAEKTALEAGDPEYYVTYYRVGDRFLVLLAAVPDPNPVISKLGLSILTSFDARFNQIAVVGWQ